VSPGSNTLKAIAQHFENLQDGEQRRLEMDFFGTPIVGKKAARALIEDWDLDLENLYWRQPYLVPARRRPPKLVHKILFSMPAGTSPDKLLAAVRDFVQQTFAERHRYGLALHTDDPHPHVHLVLKATNEEGRHLNIRKPMLHQWRREFARLLNAQGIAARATRRLVARRRDTRLTKLRGIYRSTDAPPRHTGWPLHSGGKECLQHRVPSVTHPRGRRLK
jgi:hypothetical protein